MKKPLFLVVDPEIPSTFLDDVMHDSAGRRTHRNETATFEVSDAAKGGDPDSAAVILKQGMGAILRQPVALAVNRYQARVPSVQAIARANPNATVPGSQDGNQ